MASLKDIAKACGVSTATVSKALNDQSDISQATKEKVKKVAKELGYRPNLAAKALKTKRSQNIGVLFVDDNRSGLTHDYFADVLDNFKKTVEEKGYDITFINCSKTGPNNMSYLEHVRSKGFDGVAIACINFDSPEVKELVDSDIPIVTVDYVFNNVSAVLSNNAQGMTELMEYILDKGHTKVAYIHGAASAVTNNRLSAFHRTTLLRGIEVPDEYILEAPYRDIKAVYSKTKMLLELPDPPTCILFPDDFSGIGGLNAIREKGLRIPDDISVAGYDGIKISHYLEPQLTTYSQNTAMIGHELGRKLIDHIENPKTTLVENLSVTGHVREGRSVKDLSKQNN